MIARRFILLVCLTLSPLIVRAEDVLVFAAASLKEPLDVLAAQHGGVRISYGGSGTLARQVLAGAPADIVILAHPVWMDTLLSAGRIAGPAEPFLSNALVLIAPTPAAPLSLNPEAIQARLAGGRLALGLVRSVPAGIYAQAALENLGLWDHLSDRLAEVDNVRAALALVARGEAPLGVVYATDARISESVVVVARIPADSTPAIAYELGLITGQVRPEVTEFANLLRGEIGQAAFEGAGFIWTGAAP